MNTLITKYVNAYQNEPGSSTQKVKKILMHHAHSWDWANADSLVADLIDDANITADDIVDFLADTYEHEGGNEEFHCAVRALQVCLRKKHLAETVHQDYNEKDEEPEAMDYDNTPYGSHHDDLLHRLKY